MYLKFLQDNYMCPEENKLEIFTEIEDIFVIIKQREKKEENSNIS